MPMSVSTRESLMLEGGPPGLRVFSRDRAVFQQAANQGWTVLATAGGTEAKQPDRPGGTPLSLVGRWWRRWGPGCIRVTENQREHHLGEAVWSDSLSLCPWGSACGPLGAMDGAPSPRIIGGCKLRHADDPGCGVERQRQHRRLGLRLLGSASSAAPVRPPPLSRRDTRSRS